MLWFYEHLEFFVLGLFVFGITLHFLMRRLERRRYRELRDAYELAIRDASGSDGEPTAVVREAELRRAFMTSFMPGWFNGFGRCLGRWFKYCAAFAFVALFLKGPIMRGEEEYARGEARVAAARAAKAKVATSRQLPPRMEIGLAPQTSSLFCPPTVYDRERPTP